MVRSLLVIVKKDRKDLRTAELGWELLNPYLSKPALVNKSNYWRIKLQPFPLRVLALINCIALVAHKDVQIIPLQVDHL